MFTKEIQHIESLAGVLRILVRGPFEFIGLRLGARLRVIHSKVVDQERHLRLRRRQRHQQSQSTLLTAQDGTGRRVDDTGMYDIRECLSRLRRDMKSKEQLYRALSKASGEVQLVRLRGHFRQQSALSQDHSEGSGKVGRVIIGDVV